MKRFPTDFMFQLTQDESDSLRSQIVISKGKGGRRYLLYASPERGIAMFSSVLRSERAIQVDVAIMWVFVKLREIMTTHRDLARKVAELERHLENHDQQIQSIFEAIRQLMSPEEKPKRKIGFGVREPKPTYGTRAKKKS